MNEHLILNFINIINFITIIYIIFIPLNMYYITIDNLKNQFYALNNINIYYLLHIYYYVS